MADPQTPSDGRHAVIAADKRLYGTCVLLSVAAVRGGVGRNVFWVVGVFVLRAVLLLLLFLLLLLGLTVTVGG